MKEFVYDGKDNEELNDKFIQNEIVLLLKKRFKIVEKEEIKYINTTKFIYRLKEVVQ